MKKEEATVGGKTTPMVVVDEDVDLTDSSSGSTDYEEELKEDM